MSKIKAFMCDCCGVIFPDDEIVGVVVKKENSLFEGMGSYNTHLDPDKWDIHISVPCYKAKVLIAAANMVNRVKVGEVVYKEKIKELTYSVLQSAVRNFRKKIR